LDIFAKEEGARRGEKKTKESCDKRNLMWRATGIRYPNRRNVNEWDGPVPGRNLEGKIDREEELVEKRGPSKRASEVTSGRRISPRLSRYRRDTKETKNM